MTERKLRAGILGAGYISDFHVKAICKQDYAEVLGICDLNEQAARKLASNYGDIAVFNDLDKMLEELQLDVVHVLTQPDSHTFLAKKIIKAGCNVILEKPATTNAQEAVELKQEAIDNNVNIAINHNFVFSRPFIKLLQAIDDGKVGPIKTIRVVWKKVLPQINFGPWNLWMLRAPENILFETGSHSLSELLSLVDAPENFSVETFAPKTLPSGIQFFRRWKISGLTNGISIQIDTAFDYGYEQHFVEVEGLFGVAKADIENDVFTIDCPTGRAYDSERLHVNLNAGVTRATQAIKTYGSYALSKFINSAKGGPYEASMLEGIENCYKQIKGEATRKESGIDYAIEIAQAAEKIQQCLPDSHPSDSNSTAPTPSSKPEKDAKILIVGASGFIGKKLLISLMEQGKAVRAMVRNASSLTGVTLNEHSEVIVGDYRNKDLATSALQGIETVFHLAVSHSNSLEGYLKADSEPTLDFAKSCIESNIKKFIYTGTIDSLYLGPGAGQVKESDGVDKNISRRNNYAHSKAITESKLRDLHLNQALPLVIIRPAIVLGPGGPVNHVGVANWSGIGRCAYWGDGNHNLPLVLADDIVKALVSAIDSQEAIGKTYNLSSPSLLTARDYVREVEGTLGAKIQSEDSHYLPLFMADFFKWMIKVIARHPDRTRVPSIRDWRCREQHASFNTEQARRDLSWAPTEDIEELIEIGIRQPTREFLEG